MSSEASATFKDASNLYRYTLCFPGRESGEELCLTRAELISATHKLIRRRLTAELCYLVRAFFEAVCHEARVRRVTTSLKGSISNFINRVTISLFEEGVFIHCSDEILQKVCKALVAVAECHNAANYVEIAEHLEHALTLMHGVYRGRLGSVVMAYSAHKHPLPEDVAERDLISKLDPAYVTDNATPKNFAAHVKLKMPILYPLTQLLPYKNCAEFRRVCVMNAPIEPFIPKEYKGSTNTPIIPITKRVPTRELLRAIGALDDVHTKGKRNREAWCEFLDKGMKVANETPMWFFGLSYTELEALYREGKMKDLDDGVWDVKKPKKVVSEETVVAKEIVTAMESAVQTTVAMVVTRPLGRCFESEAALLALTDSSKLLGFKNGTVIGELREAVGPLLPGERVFFKMGESYNDFAFAAQCAKWQEEMGLPFAKTELVWVKPSLQWWCQIRTDSSNKGDWSASLQKHLNARIKREKVILGYMPCIIASCFDGIRVTEAPYDDLRFGLSLAKNLLFAKHVGIKDVGPFNMLVSNAHDVLIVDISKPSTKQMDQYNTKGLFTSHKFVDGHKNAIITAFKHHRNELIQFCLGLQALPRASDDKSFWKAVGEVAPFLLHDRHEAP